MDGADELIEALAADGFRMAVGSSGPPENVQLAIEKLRSGRLISATGDRRGCDTREARSAGLSDGGRAAGRAAGVVCGDRRCGTRRHGGKASWHGGDRADGHVELEKIWRRLTWWSIVCASFRPSEFVN